MTACVLVDRDGRVTEQLLEWTEVYRVPRRVPLAASWESFSVSAAPIAIPVDEYVRRGRMFDGRPVLCMEPYTVREVAATMEAPRVSRTSAVDEECWRQVERLVEASHSGATFMDREVGVAPLTDDERRALHEQGLMRRWAHALVLVRVSGERLEC